MATLVRAELAKQQTGGCLMAYSSMLLIHLSLLLCCAPGGMVSGFATRGGSRFAAAQSSDMAEAGPPSFDDVAASSLVRLLIAKANAELESSALSPEMLTATPWPEVAEFLAEEYGDVVPLCVQRLRTKFSTMPLRTSIALCLKMYNTMARKRVEVANAGA